MKVYASPVPYAEPDYAHCDWSLEQKREDDHLAAIRVWLKDHGYNGPHSGKEFSRGVADGCARYILADGGYERRSFLIHLPYGDGYQYRDIEHLPKAVIIKEINRASKLKSIFAK